MTAQPMRKATCPVCLKNYEKPAHQPITLTCGTICGQAFRRAKTPDGQWRKGNQYDDQVREAVELYNSGKTRNEAAQQVGLSCVYIWRRGKELGLPTRTNRAFKDRTIKDLKDVDAAYMAALVDGEGSITMHVEGSATKLPVGAVLVTNTSMALMDWLTETIGGGVRYKSRVNEKSPLKSNYDCYTWRVHRHNDVIALLEMIQPYLIIKRHKCEHILDVLHGRAEFDKTQLAHRVS